MLDKNALINEIIDREGGYVNDPQDSGGETMYGVTRAVARDYGYTELMVDLPRETAFSIYEDMYWDSVRAGEVLRLSSAVAAELVDTAINTGPVPAVRFLQRALNVLNRKGTLYPDIQVDGRMGPASLGALRLYLRVRSESALVRALNCLQGTYYIELAERREKDERFVYGWLQQRVSL